MEVKKIGKKIGNFFGKLKNQKIITSIVDRERKIKEKLSERAKNIKSVMAVDIGSSSIKVVQLSKVNGIAVLDTFGEIALGPFIDKPVGYPVKLDPRTLSHALDIILDEAGVDSLDVSYCISPNQSFYYNFNYDTEKDKKIKINDFLIAKIKEKFNVETREYDIDYFEIGSGYDEYSDTGKNIKKYRVIGIKKKILEYNKNLSKSLNLKMKLEETEAKSILYAINKFFPKDYLIIDIGSSSTKIYAINQDEVYDYKVFKLGTHNIAKDFKIKKNDFEKSGIIGGSMNSFFSEGVKKEIEKNSKSESLDHVLKEIYSFLKEFEVNEQKFIKDIVLTGGGAFFQGLEKYLSDKLKREIKIADPFSKVKNPSFATEKLKEVGPEYTAAIGLALESLNE